MEQKYICDDSITTYGGQSPRFLIIIITLCPDTCQLSWTAQYFYSDEVNRMSDGDGDVYKFLLIYLLLLLIKQPAQFFDIQTVPLYFR